MNSTSGNGGAAMGAGVGRIGISRWSVALAAGLLACATVHAQQGQSSVARLKSVSGNVLVSQDVGMSTGSAAQRLNNGMRVITTANSEAVIEYDNGCEVRLKENERIEIDSDRLCAALIPTPLGAQVAALGPGLIPLVVLPITGIGIILTDPGPSVSPN